MEEWRDQTVLRRDDCFAADHAGSAAIRYGVAAGDLGKKTADKREHVAQLVDDIFRILSESEHWLTAAPTSDDEDRALAYEDEPVLGDRLE